MTFQIQGASVFGGAVYRARLIFDYNDADPLNPCVLYSEALTNEIAIKVINNGIRGLITHESSFATHGANIIRGYCHKTGNRIAWISGVPKSEIDQLANGMVDICDGLITCSESVDNRLGMTRCSCSQTKYVPQPSRCLVRHNITNSNRSICYWPHRSYDLFTFSIMESGLKKNYSLYLDKDIQITRDEMGHIWFEDGLYLRDLIEKANNTEIGNTFLEHQMACYDEICGTLRGGKLDPAVIIRLLIKYFSVFLLFHNTYEYVFQKAYCDFEVSLPDGGASEFLDFLMFCEIDEWMFKLGYPLEKNKDLFSAEPITPIPEFSVYVDVAHKQQAVKAWFGQHNLLEQYFEKKEQIEYWVRVFVVKEWKFLINKLLFTRMSAIMRKFPQEVICEIKQQSYSKWLKMESKGYT